MILHRAVADRLLRPPFSKEGRREKGGRRKREDEEKGRTQQSISALEQILGRKGVTELSDTLALIFCGNPTNVAARIDFRNPDSMALSSI